MGHFFPKRSDMLKGMLWYSSFTMKRDDDDDLFDKFLWWNVFFSMHSCKYAYNKLICSLCDVFGNENFLLMKDIRL